MPVEAQSGRWRRVVAGMATALLLSACAPVGTAAPAGPGGSLSWTRTSIPCDSAAVGDLVTAGSGFALSCPESASPIWISPDGMTWTEAAIPPTADFVLRSVPAGLYIHDGARAWYSEDATTWLEVDLGTASLERSLVAAGGAGALIVDSRTDEAWASTDGTTFHPVGRVPQLDGTTSLLATDRGFIISSLYVDPVPGAEWSTALWVSRDGREWLEAGDAPLDGTIRFGSDGAQAAQHEHVDSAGAASSGGAVLVLSRHVGFGITPAYNLPREWADAIWRSDDGRNWQDITDDPALAGGHFRLIAGGDFGWLVIGQNWGTPVWWFSSDGEMWEQAPQEVSTVEASSPDLTRPPNRTLAAVGTAAVLVAVDPIDGPPLLWVGAASPDA
jgi:hypothetical protein